MLQYLSKTLTLSWLCLSDCSPRCFSSFMLLFLLFMHASFFPSIVCTPKLGILSKLRFFPKKTFFSKNMPMPKIAFLLKIGLRPKYLHYICLFNCSASFFFQNYYDKSLFVAFLYDVFQFLFLLFKP